MIFSGWFLNTSEAAKYFAYMHAVSKYDDHTLQADTGKRNSRFVLRGHPDDARPRFTLNRARSIYCYYSRNDL